MTTDVFFQDLGNGITCIDTMLQRRGVAACYLIEQEGMAGFIDTGTNNSIPVLLEVLKRKKIPRENVAYVMPTHVHLDHAGATGGLMLEFPNAQLIVHPRGARHMIDPSRLQQGSLEVYGESAFAERFGDLIPVQAERVIEAADEFELDFNGRKLLFLDTQGHARHHYCVFDELSQGLFTGDTFGASYPELNQGRAPFIFPPTTPIQFDPEAWYESLKRLMSFDPKRVYLTHFGMHENVAELYVQLRLTIKDYAETAQEFRASEDSQQKIADSILQSGINHLLDQQCGVDIETIKKLIGGDMKLNAQGLQHWLSNS